jgi:2-polyprenyl-6-hydroxyphenyl methylase / 3-demethylubiquinone-9 3-methyltransferase
VVDVRQTLGEIYRVLKPGGRFCFDTINRTMKSKAIMIWLLEDLLGEIPRGIHDWEKFIVPELLQGQMEAVGFGSSEVKGFNIFGISLADHWKAYWHYRRTGAFQIKINEDLAVMYIGVAIKG